MKKLYFSFLSIIALTSLNAQYAVTASNIPVAGEVNNYYIVDTNSVPGPGPAGSGLTYSFTMIVADTISTPRNYVAPSTTANSADFPNSLVAMTDNGITSYFRGTSNYELDGLVINFSGVNGTAILSDRGVIFPSFPYGYGSSNYDTLSGTVATGFGSGTVVGGITTTVDGSGTLDLPGASFSNVIRVKMYTHMFIDLSLITSEYKETRYMFFSSASKFPLFETGILYAQGAIDPPQSFAYLNDVAFVGMKETKNSNSFTLFPNPAKNDFTINLNSTKAVNVAITNQMGQLVKTEMLNSNSASPTINLAGLSSGIYSVRVYNGEINEVKKLVIE
jgi:hypothetical protein